MLSRFACLLCFTGVVASASAENFPNFRGIGGVGVSPAQTIPNRWSENENLAWKVKVPGSGWSQPIIWEDRVIVTAAVGDEDWKPKDFAGGVRTPQSMGVSVFAKPPQMNFNWTVICFSRTDGSILWQTSVTSGSPKYAVHPSNTYATETPVADENGIYVSFGATGTVAGLTHDGSIRWKQELGAFKTSNSFGTGSSLAIHEGRVFVQNHSEETADLHCFASETGEKLWTVSRDDNKTSWSSPLIWKNEQRTELIVSGGEQVDSVDPITGEVLWTVKNVKAATASSPCCDQKRLYFGSSDPFSKGPLFAISAGASGDVSPAAKNDSFDHCDWLVERAAPGMASPISSGQYVYTINNNIIRCFDVSDGKKMYENRLPGLKMVAASPVMVGDRLLILGEKGAACLIADGPTFDVVAEGKLEDTFWATPAVADGEIYFRGVEYLYCVRGN